jgi:hypothetical protein
LSISPYRLLQKVGKEEQHGFAVVIVEESALLTVAL